MAGEGLDNRFDRLNIAPFARKTAIEIDHMEMLRASFCKDQGLRRRIIAIDGCAVHIAFGQPDDFA